MGLLAAAVDRNHDATVRGMTRFVFWAWLVFAAMFGQFTGASSSGCEALRRTKTIRLQKVHDRFGSSSGKFSIEFDRANGVGVAQHDDPVDLAVLLLDLPNQGFDGANALGLEIGFSEFEQCICC